jgi:hypothetical protein
VGAPAQVLLVVNETDPSAVTITATGAASSASVSTTFFDGFDLLNFFNQDASQGGADPNVSTLTTGDSSTGPIFNNDYSDDESTTADGNPPYYDLNIYVSSPTNAGQPAPGNPTETFTSGSTAFIGTMTINLSAYSLSGASTGIVYGGTSFDDAGSANDIGTYVLEAPEPSTYAMMLGGLVVLGFCVRRKLA